MAYHPSHPVEDFLVEAYTEPLRTFAGRRALSRSAAALFSAEAGHLAARYARVTVPSLLLWGREDRVVPLSVGRRLASEMPVAELEILERCGHMPQEEAAEESLEALFRFLERTASRP